ncbi:hypothetical protein [Mycolicibacterium aichiense]|uniref:PE family protein n=1 Tax=Mycolicibacterium aichiense TaxID=1799 RepID=A0AAD1MDZ0_9MYCO|nr:hypothetical protein [Mycolicibacterium aichiense]MCV7016808.1 hypothetical protein [Mycolicibacterium aichiense]BBX09406.1 hypothetical protein MAIC_42090 [Mycolicibacterium aichiense]SUA13972.1 Uncharacterised protein [Mycolicibacterium aichiense]
MTVSVRSYLTAGIAAAVVGAVALTPVQPSAPAAMSLDSVRLSAAVQPLVNQVNAAAATIGAPDVAPSPGRPAAAKTAQANNAASDAIDAAYQWVLYWGNYFALDLGPYLLGWIPFGYLISDQIYIWYPNFTVPVANSVVYDFLDPVVNDFWNPTVWRNGLTAIAQTTLNSLGVVGTQEVAYFWSLQWFPFPLPPLPPLPFAALKTPAAAASAGAAVEQKTETATAKSGLAHSGRPQAVTQTADAADDTAVTAQAVTDTNSSVDTPAPKVVSTNKSAKADSSASSDKGGSTKSGATSGAKKSTGGSARSKAAKGNS